MTDRAFWKSFAGLIATLMAVAVALFVVAQIIGKSAKTTEATADAKAVAERIKSYAMNSFSVVVVVSAMGKTTDELISLQRGLRRA